MTFKGYCCLAIYRVDKHLKPVGTKIIDFLVVSNTNIQNNWDAYNFYFTSESIAFCRCRVSTS